MSNAAERTPLDQYQDNDEAAFSVLQDGTRDITARVTRRETVTKRQVREMFIKFVQNSPDLRSVLRVEQIVQFNLERRELDLPKVDADVLQDLLVPFP
jgi:hypothetical protein